MKRIIVAHKRKISWLTVTVAAFFVLVFGATALVSSDYIRDRLTTGFSTKLGREVKVNGPYTVQWRWGRTRVTAENVTISDAKDSGSPDANMLEIQKLDMRIKVLPLLFGSVNVPEILLVKPRIVLEKYGPGKANWDFAASSKANVLQEIVVPDNRREFPKLGYVRVHEGQLIYRDIPRKLALDLQLDIARAADQKSKNTFVFNGKGKLEDHELTVKGEGGSLEILRDSSADYPLFLSIVMGGTKAQLEGTFRDPVKLAGLDAKLELSGGNLADLFHLTHIPLPPTPAYQLSGALKKEGDKWSFEKFAGKMGGSDLSGDVVYNTEPERPILSGAVFSKVMDVDDLGGFVGYGPRSGAPSGKVLPDVPLDLTRFRAADIDLTLKADKLRAPGLPLNAMHAHFNLRNGLLKVDPLAFGVAGGNVSGSIMVDGRKEVPAVDINLDLKRLSVKQFLTSQHLDALATSVFGGKINLAGHGKSTADVFATSNGRVLLIMTGGRISLKVVEAADLDIAELLPLVFGKDKTTQMRCAAGDFAVQKGMLHSRLFIIDTDDTNFKGDAKVNLRNEKIDIAIDARPKDGSLLSLQSDVLIGGTFKDPDVGIDMAEAGARGAGAVILGALMPIAAILPFIEGGNGKDVNCANLIERAKNPVKAKVVKPKVKPLRDAQR